VSEKRHAGFLLDPDIQIAVGGPDWTKPHLFCDVDQFDGHT
jgi:hypothetical protein